MGGSESIAGKRVVITGAGRGLGRELAIAFDGAGAELALVARTQAALEETAGVLSRPPLVFAGDVRDDSVNESIVDAMNERLGGVDVWICNAGISPQLGDVTSTSAEAWREIIDVNLTGTFLGARAAATAMHEGGRIIVTGSVLGIRPRGQLAAYSASKAAVHALVQVMAQELGPRRITVNAVAPGWFAAGVGDPWSRNEDRAKDIVAHTALGRWGRPEELVGAYLYLASDASDFVTGAILSVDGGYCLV